MKKVLAIVITVIMLAAMTTVALAAPTYVGETTVAMSEYAGLEITFSDAASMYGSKIESAYGTYNLFVGKAGSTVTFSKTVKLGNMGADAGEAAAGVAVKPGDINGYYVYADDGVLYSIFCTPDAMQYNEESLTAKISAITVKKADDAAPATEPVTEPVPVVEPAPVAEPVPAAEPAPVAEPAGTPAAVDTPAAVTLAPYKMPAELTAAGAFELGAWPLEAGMYDPNLDSAGIPKGAYVYGLYEFDMTTFTGTNFDFPVALSGYTKAASVSALTAGTYAEAVIGGYNYIILVPAAGVAPATADMTNVAPFAIVCVIAALGIVFAIPRKSKDN